MSLFTTHPDTYWMDILVPPCLENEIVDYINNCPEIDLYDSRLNVDFNKIIIRISKK